MLEKILDKIHTLPSAMAMVASWRQSNQKIIWTNGVFDLLHRGHLTYLCAARDLGDKLIVGVNSDSSVKRLKGEGRPVNNQDARLWQMASLLMTDLIILFEEDTPLSCIQKLKPDVLVKGGDYDAAEVVGGKEARTWNGNVVIIPFEPGFSSTDIIYKIKNLPE